MREIKSPLPSERREAELRCCIGLLSPPALPHAQNPDISFACSPSSEKNTYQRGIKLSPLNSST